MDSNGGRNKINVGVLSLSKLSVVASFLDRIEKESHDNSTFNPIFIQLSAEDLDNQTYTVKNEVRAVVLLHSIMEGRFSVTDVPDARYNNLLPRLKYLFGSKSVGVVAHSMPNFSDVTKRVQMKVFKARQHTTFTCSGCVIICGKLAEMSEDDWNGLTSFIALAPGQRMLQPSDAAEQPISKERSESLKIVCEVQPPQADSHPPRKQMKAADQIKFVIITSEGDSVSFEVIKDDICKKTSFPITIEICTTNDWKAKLESAHAVAVLLPEKDLVDLSKKVPPNMRTNVSIFRPLRSQVSTEGSKQFKRFEYEVNGDSTSNSVIRFSKKTLKSVVSWIEECYQNRSKSDENQTCVMV